MFHETSASQSEGDLAQVRIATLPPGPRTILHHSGEKMMRSSFAQHGMGPGEMPDCIAIRFIGTWAARIFPL